MVRFEIESAILKGELAVKDLPEAWNAKYEEYLGIRPTTDSEGCLQDVHWSQGSIGYFPTYSMGNLLSYQIWAQAAGGSRRHGRPDRGGRLRADPGLADGEGLREGPLGEAEGPRSGGHGQADGGGRIPRGTGREVPLAFPRVGPHFKGGT